MRSWKKASTCSQAVFLYFHAHPETFFTPEHIAAQIKVGVSHTKRIIRKLERMNKIEAVDAVSSLAWGRPKRMFRAVRASADSLAQMEAFLAPGKDKPDLIVTLRKRRSA